MKERQLWFVVALVVTLASVQSQDSEHQVGERGARVVLGKDWVKRKLDPDLGPYQWIVSKRVLLRRSEAHVVVREAEMLLENADDHTHAMTKMTALGYDEPIQLHDEGGYTRSVRSFEAKIDGASLAFHVEMLHRDGLAFCVLGWAAPQDRRFLAERIDEFRSRFTFPGGDSAFAKSTQPTVADIELGGARLRFEIRPSVFRSRPLQPNLAGWWCSADEEHAILVVRPESRTQPDRQLSEAVRELGEDDTVTEVQRSDLDLRGVRSRMVVAKGQFLTYHLVSIPLPGSRTVQVRYLSRGNPDVARADRERFFRTLRVEASSDEFSLPPIPEDDAFAAKSSPFDDVTEVVATPTLRWLVHGARTSDGGFVVADGEKLEHVGADGTRQTLWHREQFFGDWSVTQWQGQWWVVDDRVARPIVDGRTAGDGIVATHIATAGQDLLLTRKPARPERVVLVPQRASDALVLRKPDGTETVVSGDLGIDVRHLVTTADGKHAVAFEAMSWWPDRIEPGEPRRGCLRIDVAARTVVAGEPWDSVEAVVAADRGWLVTGRPKNRPSGLYRLSVDGSVEPLLLTAARGLGLDGTQLWFVLYGAANGAQIRSLDLAGVDASVRMSQPFAAADVHAIAAELAQTHGTASDMGTAAYVRRAVEAADALAIARVGRPLPKTPPAIDGLFVELRESVDGATTHARWLLALVGAAHALDTGAEWVEAANATMLDWIVAVGVEKWSPFAVATSPAHWLVAASEYEESGIADFASGSALRDGRVWIVGLDPHATAERASAKAPTEIDAALAAGDAAKLKTALESVGAHRAARTHVYRRLADRAAFAALEELGRHFAATAAAADVDHVAWLTGLLQRQLSGDEATAAFDQAMRSVQLHPGDPELCWLLAVACEKAKPETPALARACYQRLLSIRGYGAIADQARAALERLASRR
jgi:hypothetical protein